MNLADSTGAIVFFAVMSLLAGFSSWLTRKLRGRTLTRIQKDLGLTFSAKERFLEPVDADFELFKRGFKVGEGVGKASISNIFEGTVSGTRLMIFDYGYSKETEVESFLEPVNQTVALFYPPQCNLPIFELKPTGVMDRLFSSGSGIKFTDSLAFSKHYYVTGPDEPAIRAAFTANVLMYFIEYQGWGWSVESNGQRLIVYMHNELIKPKKLRIFIDGAMAAFNTLYNSKSA